MVLNIGLNFILIPQGHALGAAWASLITQGVMAVAQMLVAARRYSFRMQPKAVLGFAVYLLLLLGVAWGLKEGSVSFLTALLVLASTAAIGSLATGLLPIQGLRSLLLLRKEA